jgi:cytoskeletal protein CcmA (bactofilin family)
MASSENSVRVGRGAQLSGVIRAAGDVVIEGSFEGEIVCAHLSVGPDGEVKGEIEIQTGDIAGRVEADMRVSHLLSLRATARVDGSFDCGALEIERGAILNGAIGVTAAGGARDNRLARVEAEAARILREAEEAPLEEIEEVEEAEEVEDLPARTPLRPADASSGRRGALHQLRQFPMRTPRRSAG